MTSDLPPGMNSKRPAGIPADYEPPYTAYRGDDDSAHSTAAGALCNNRIDVTYSANNYIVQYEQVNWGWILPTNWIGLFSRGQEGARTYRYAGNNKGRVVLDAGPMPGDYINYYVNMPGHLFDIPVATWAYNSDASAVNNDDGDVSIKTVRRNDETVRYLHLAPGGRLADCANELGTCMGTLSLVEKTDDRVRVRYRRSIPLRFGFIDYCWISLFNSQKQRRTWEWASDSEGEVTISMRLNAGDYLGYFYSLERGSSGVNLCEYRFS